MGKYLIIAGHGKKPSGKIDNGASGYIKQGEHDFIKNDFFNAMKKYASNDFIFFSDYNVFAKGNLTSLASKYGRNTKVVEIHFDASSNKKASGGHVIIWQNFRPDRMDLNIRDAIKKVMGINKAYNHKGYEGISGRNLQNARIASRNGINYRLVELGFGTNKRDADILLNNTDKYAKELVKAISGKTIKNETVSKPSKRKTDEQLMNEVLSKGLNGQARKRYLGNRYDGVQKLINSIYTTNKHYRKTDQQLMNEVLRKGLNGQARKDYLGNRYAGVQKKINKKYL